MDEEEVGGSTDDETAGAAAATREPAEGAASVRPEYCLVAGERRLRAASLAGLAVGFWEDLDELRANWQVDERWEPKMGAETRANLYQSWKKAVKESHRVGEDLASGPFLWRRP